MAPPKKTVKMDLNSFLNDESFGESWAEEEVDLEKINIPLNAGKPSKVMPLESFGSSKGSRLDPALAPEKKERVEYDIPDHPPYRAVINNLPWDVSEDGIKAWFEDGLNKPGAVEEVVAPKDFNDPAKLKGFAFVTLCDRDALAASLKFNATKLNERMVFVSVAAPPKGGFGNRGGFDDNIDWGSARGSNFHAGRPNREEPDLDWGSMRGANFHASAERRPRAEEPDLDWGAMRGSNFHPTADRKPRREEPELDWGAMRGSNFQASRERKPRREEPEIDWSSARGSNFSQRPPRAERRPRNEPELDWGGARGSKFGQRSTSKKSGQAKAASSPTQDAPKIQRSAFEVLAADDDDEEENTKPEEVDPKKSTNDISNLEKATAKLSVEGEDDDWKVVGKK
ncbi:LAFE_0G17678g1_1 [Lachancea fermentati]|uniref:LAFE_0G17678g1_1 n=1 Tax=Lachancea fermentati TaxID=4955 RepID=A0A1G4MIV1_LACFM|nr:LAFE_0G17678g1_1 [Lachancea fermentati]